MHSHLPRINRILLFLVLLSSALSPWQTGSGQEREAVKGMVATVHPVATDYAVQVLQDGGNAVDAAVAAGLMLGVVDSHNSGIGGGCFILIRTADGQLIAIDGRETAPAAAHRDLYLKEGEPQPQQSQTGPLAVAVPGALAAYQMAIAEHGHLSLEHLLRPAAEQAAAGFVVTESFAAVLAAKAEQLSQFEGSKAALLQADGTPYREGEILRQPDLAATYHAVADHGIEWFYKGPFAAQVTEWMEANGGILVAEDFAQYQAKLREPIVTQYRDYTVVGFPPPSSGGVHVAQILGIVEHFPLAELRRQDPASATHVIAEAMKLAFADRAYWLGDADFVDVPRGLIDPQYARQLASRIRLDQSIEVESHGVPPRADAEFFNRHTTHIAVADEAGNWVAMTQTVNTSFGSKVVVPGTGVVLNNEMDDFSIAPGTRNAFGLVGAEANQVEAFKRPLSSMSPTIILKDGEPFMTVGAAGGPKIITQAVLAIIRHLDFEMPLEEALAAPRFHHQWSPDRLLIERTLDEAQQDRLEALGHTLYRSSSVGYTQAISRADGRLSGAHDPRVDGKAAGN